MSQKTKELEVTNKPTKWEDLEQAYKATAQTYLMVNSYFINLYKKYKELMDKEPNVVAILDGGANTLLGIKKMIDALAVSHITPATDKDKENGVEVFEGPDGKLSKFKTGNIDTDNDEETELVIRNLLAYTSLSGNLFIVSKNTISSLVTDLEKVINELEDEAEKEKFLKLLESDKKEIDEAVEKEEVKEEVTDDKGENDGDNEQK